MNTLLTLSNIAFKVGDKSILQDINIDLHEREIVTIIGPNGAGKTTLLSVALGLLAPTLGSVTRHQINDKPLSIGYVPQLVNRDATMPISVIEFMCLAKHSPSKSMVKHLLTDLKLAYLSNAFLSDLSGGELRRVLFARALLNRPHLLVLDEPTAGVDTAGQESFYHQLNELREHYKFAILMVSHELHLVMSTTDRVLCLNRHICCQGKPVQVINDPHYRSLFGKEVMKDNVLSSDLAFYHHEHDHTH